MQLDNRFFQLEVLPEEGVFNLTPAEQKYPAVRSASLAVTYSHPGKIIENIHSLSPLPVRKGMSLGVHGLGQELVFNRHQPDSPLSVQIEFCLPDTCPFLFWRMGLKNDSPRPISIERIELLNTRKEINPIKWNLFPSSQEETWFLRQRLAILVLQRGIHLRGKSPPHPSGTFSTASKHQSVHTRLF